MVKTSASQARASAPNYGFSLTFSSPTLKAIKGLRDHADHSSAKQSMANLALFILPRIITRAAEGDRDSWRDLLKKQGKKTHPAAI